jgi:phage terminase small subunit
MPRGGARVGAGRPKGSGKKKADPAKVRQPLAARVDAVVEETVPVEVASAAPVDLVESPLDYMLRVINDPTLDGGRRDRMAVAAAPYVHARVEPAGKKTQVQGKATDAVKGGGKFTPAAGPRLVHNRG